MTFYHHGVGHAVCWQAGFPRHTSRVWFASQLLLTTVRQVSILVSHKKVITFWSKVVSKRRFVQTKRRTRPRFSRPAFWHVPWRYPSTYVSQSALQEHHLGSHNGSRPYLQRRLCCVLRAWQVNASGTEEPDTSITQCCLRISAHCLFTKPPTLNLSLPHTATST